MSKSKRSHSASFKAKVALTAIKEELTQAQITSQYSVHSTQIGKWKKQALDAVTTCFSQKLARDKVNQEAELSRLYEEIGRLQAELSWLKKKI